MSFYRQLINREDIPTQFKRYISVLDSQAAKVKCSKDNENIIIPDIFFASRDNTMAVVKLFADYLAEISAFKFIGENKIISITINELGGNSGVEYMCGKISDILTLAVGFRGTFKGIVYIDIHSKNFADRNFTEIMKFIKENTYGCIRVIVADISKEYKVNEMEETLINAGYIIQTIRKDTLSGDNAMTFLTVKLKEFDFEIVQEGKETIKIMIDHLIKSNKLTTLAGVDLLCDDLLFYLLKNDCPQLIPGKIIDKYFKQCIMCRQNDNTKHNIGFARE